MYKKTKTVLKTNVVNLFAALGYLSCTVQWLWVLLLYSNVLQSYLRSVTPEVQKPVIETPTIVVNGFASSLFLVLGTILSIAVIVVFIYLAIRTPKFIAKTATKVVQNTAETIAPAVLRIERKADTPKNRKKIVINLKLLIKLLVILVPFVGSIVSIYTNNPIYTSTVVLYSSSMLLAVTLLLFFIQYILARLLKVDIKKLW